MKNYQASRYELKYIVTEAQAQSMAEFVRAHLAPDRYTQTCANQSIGYQVCSLYLDSRDRACYSQTQQGEKNRFKLRMRFYDEAPTSPVFLEIKRRVTQVVQKKRAAISRDAAERLLRGASPEMSMLLKNSPAERDGLLDFCRLRDQIGAVSQVFVDYYRKAYESHRGNEFRITFDRQVSGSAFQAGRGLRLPAERTITKIQGVVFEMKFINQPAEWMLNLARQFQLQAISVPKYVESVDVVVGAKRISETLLRGQY